MANASPSLRDTRARCGGRYGGRYSGRHWVGAVQWRYSRGIGVLRGQPPGHTLLLSPNVVQPAS
eukprot:137951-Chlamydomonas_euryale.AAC.2